MKELPDIIGSLINLKTLDLAFTTITELSAAIGSLTNLKALRLTCTKITKLPASIVSLTNLKVLDLSCTKIIELPENIGLLTNLKNLDLSHCQLKRLPRSILNLELPFVFEEYSKYGIVLHKTKLLEMHISDFKQPREYIEQQYNELEKSMVLFNESRVIFLGDGGTGKTTIIEMLKGKPYIENREKTNGIFINELNIDRNKEEKIVLHLWDFGGQEIYHSMHEMFLRDNCIYVVVLDGRKEDRPEYWLDFIKHYGKNSPTLLVVNKCDDGIKRNQFSLYELAEKYSTSIVCDFEPCYISCKYQSGLTEFKEKLVKLVNMVPGYRKAWSLSWLKAKQRLEDMRDSYGNIINYIDQRTYHRYCEDVDVNELINKKALLAKLCDIGTVFSYQSKDQNNIIDDLKVLRPEWITKGIYTIINSQISKKCNGYIPLKKMEEVFTVSNGNEQIIEYSPSERNFVISLMEDFKMSYRIGEYEFIPSMAQSERPKILKNWNFNSSLYYETDGIFPISLLYQFIVEMSNDVNISYTWNKGTLLSSKLYNIEALVQIKDNKLYIHLNKKNEESCKYISTICGVFQQLLSGLNINYTEYIGVCHNNSWKYLNFDRIINMLAHGKKTDYIDGDGWDCDVDIREALSYITPYTVMQKINDELTITKEEQRYNKDLKEDLHRILRNNEDNHQKMRAYLETIHYDTKDIKQLLTALKKELPYDLRDISRKIDEAIVEIKTGNQESAYKKIRNVMSDLSNANTIIQLSPTIIEMIKSLIM